MRTVDPDQDIILNIIREQSIHPITFYVNKSSKGEIKYRFRIVKEKQKKGEFPTM